MSKTQNQLSSRNTFCTSSCKSSPLLNGFRIPSCNKQSQCPWGPTSTSRYWFLALAKKNSTTSKFHNWKISWRVFAVMAIKLQLIENNRKPYSWTYSGQLVGSVRIVKKRRFKRNTNSTFMRFACNFLEKPLHMNTDRFMIHGFTIPSTFY